MKKILGLLILLSCVSLTGCKKSLEVRFVDWLESINKEEQIPQEVLQLNFCLYESEEGFNMSLSGYKTIDLHHEGDADAVFRAGEKFVYEQGSDDKQFDMVYELCVHELKRYAASDAYKSSNFAAVKYITICRKGDEKAQVISE